ncbi:MAG: hypothetical protein EOP39_20720 [Rubrivivax sp.]|nr:MAG: hypothetical protein EOP39_20720 [Rubrivivax sp.]
MRRTLIALALTAAGLAQAATVSVYSSLAAWEAAIASPAQLQDFDSFANGTDLAGVAVLPGLTLSSNIAGPLRVFSSTKTAFASDGSTRATGDAYYEGQYALPFLAAALDITSFESVPGDGSTAVDQGTLTFWFDDGTTQDILLSGNTGSPTPPVFAGVISDRAITAFRWNEAHEASGGNEETSLDNLRVAMRAPTELPLPGTLALAVLALGLVPLARRRR